MALRKDVLSVYRRIFRLARTWKSESGDQRQTETEKHYMKNEARLLFKRNKIVSEEEARLHLKEAETRIELALHYRNPFPRPVNIPQNVLPPTTARLKKGQKRKIKQSKPIYMKSYEDKLDDS